MSDDEDLPDWNPNDVGLNPMTVVEEWSQFVLADKQNENAIKDAMYSTYGDNSIYFELFAVVCVVQISLLITTEFAMNKHLLKVHEDTTLKSWFESNWGFNVKDLLENTKINWRKDLTDDEWEKQISFKIKPYKDHLQKWMNQKNYIFKLKHESPFKIFNLNESTSKQMKSAVC